ncbi:MAG TPA: hypothetical protein VK176_00515 [Phycisphaerales bacterium]|nr:hypothetical protein [Phycisphaerales bacterium]
MVLSALVLGLGAGAACAQSEPCEIPLLNCGDMPYLLPGQTWTANPGWTPNRLPGVAFMLTNGNFCSANAESNYRGLNQYWCDPVDDPNCTLENSLTGVEVLESYMNAAWAMGFRRFMLYAPAGTVWGGSLPDGPDAGSQPDTAGQEYLASSQTKTIPPEKWEELATMLAGWISTHQGAWVEVYGTIATMNNPEERCLGPSQRFPEYYFPTDTIIVPEGTCTSGVKVKGCPYAGCTVFAPSPFVQDDVCAFDANIKPWQDLGIKRYWLDSAAREADNFFAYFTELAYCPLYKEGIGSKHFLGMESIPSDDIGLGGPQGPGVIDMGRAVVAPAIAFPNVFFDRDRFQNWDVSAQSQSTELVAVLDPSQGFMGLNTLKGVLRWSQRGFIPCIPNPDQALSSVLINRIKRVYDFGIIRPGDFNGDDVINAQDVTDFSAAYNCHVGMTSGCNYAHGDMDQDNDVDIRDYNKFTSYYLMDLPIDLGECNDADAVDAITRSTLPGCF